MENQYIIFGIFLLILVIVFGALYYYYKKMKQAELLNHEVQKHLLIQKKIIENHDKILHQQFDNRSNSGANATTSSPTSIPEEFHQSFATVEPLQVPETPEQRTPSPPIVNPMERVLPLVTTLMGNLFQNEQPSVDDEFSDVVRDKMEELKQQEFDEMKKKQMENEISEELEELHTTETVEEEGRVDEISVASDAAASVSVEG
jgi:hypothetical protein